MINELCSCPKIKCKNHGDCVSCRKHHSGKRKPPYCERVKRERKRGSKKITNTN